MRHVPSIQSLFPPPSPNYTHTHTHTESKLNSVRLCEQFWTALLPTVLHSGMHTMRQQNAPNSSACRDQHLRNLVGISVIWTINTTFWFKSTYSWNRRNNLGYFSPPPFRNTFCGKEGGGARERETQKGGNWETIFSAEWLWLCLRKKNHESLFKYKTKKKLTNVTITILFNLFYIIKKRNYSKCNYYPKTENNNIIISCGETRCCLSKSSTNNCYPEITMKLLDINPHSNRQNCSYSVKLTSNLEDSSSEQQSTIHVHVPHFLFL